MLLQKRRITWRILLIVATPYQFYACIKYRRIWVWNAKRTSRVLYAWVMLVRQDESCHMCMSHVAYIRPSSTGVYMSVTYKENESCLVWMGHVNEIGWVMALVHESRCVYSSIKYRRLWVYMSVTCKEDRSCLVWMGHVNETGWVMSHVHESCCVYTSIKYRRIWV